MSYEDTTLTHQDNGQPGTLPASNDTPAAP
ncbi:MAG: hypothetical protein HW388_1767, partial [Dehalococcoidia bacterium]|nr:hypothetical protein [Dehalococcoidia bacterium]